MGKVNERISVLEHEVEKLMEWKLRVEKETLREAVLESVRNLRQMPVECALLVRKSKRQWVQIQLAKLKKHIDRRNEDENQ